MEFTGIGDRIALKSSVSMGRPDLDVLDHRAINKSGARMLVGYRHGLGTPTKAEVTAFVHKEFSGKIAVLPDTIIVVATNDPHVGAVALNAVTHMERVPYEAALSDPKTYRPIDTDSLATATRVMNVVTAHVWDVERAADGSTVIHRNIEEDVDAIMKARYAKTAGRAASKVTLASVGLHTAAASPFGAPLYSFGDYVRFMANGKTQTGTVQSVSTTASGSMVKITSDSTGAVESVSLSMVIELLRAGGSSLSEDSITQEDYYAQAYGDAQFAEELTAELHGEVTAGVADTVSRICSALTQIGSVVCKIHGPSILVKRSGDQKLLASVVASKNGMATLVDKAQNVLGSNLSVETIVAQIKNLLAGRKMDRIVT